MNSLYILDIDVLSDIGFANIFSHLVGHLFIFDDFLCNTKGFQFDITLLFYFCFWCQIKKNHCQFRCQGAYCLYFLVGVLWLQALCLNLESRVPTVVQQKQIWIVSIRMHVGSLDLLSGLRIQCYHEL